MPFFSPCLTQDLIRFHLIQKTDYSYYEGLPSGIAPDITSIKALKNIDSAIIYYYRLLKLHTESFRINKLSVQLNLDQLSLTLAVNVSKKNIGELPAIIKLAGDYKIDSIDVGYTLFYNFMNKRDALFYYPELAQEKFMESEELAKKYLINLKLPILADISDNKRCKLCHVPWEKIYFFTGGEVISHAVLGNILTDSFKDAWNSNFQKKIRRSFKTRNRKLENCKNCFLYSFRDTENEKNFPY